MASKISQLDDSKNIIPPNGMALMTDTVISRYSRISSDIDQRNDPRPAWSFLNKRKKLGQTLTIGH